MPLFTRIADVPARITLTPHGYEGDFLPDSAPTDIPMGLRSVYVSPSSEVVLTVMVQVALEYTNRLAPVRNLECWECGGYVYIPTSDADEITNRGAAARVWCSEMCMRITHEDEQNADGHR